MKRVRITLLYLLYTFVTFSQSFTESQRIISPDRGVEEYFGSEVDLYGNYAVVGVATENLDKDGLNEMQNAGAAYIYKRGINGEWTLLQKITPSDRHKKDRFGSSVSIYGNYIAIGAPEESDYPDPEWTNRQGAVYIFKLSASGVWEETQKLVRLVRRGGDYFGNSVDLNGEWLIAGAHQASYGENDQYATLRNGAAVVFKLENGNWEHNQDLFSGEVQMAAEFGSRVVIENGVALVTSLYYNHQNREPGKVYFFELNNEEVWEQAFSTLPPNGFPAYNFDYFGTSLDIENEQVFIGGSGLSQEESHSNAGLIYIYEKNTNDEWEFQYSFDGSITDSNDRFGGRISVYENKMLISSTFASTPGGNNYGGVAFIFEKDQNGIWTESEYFYSSIDEYGTYFSVGATIWNNEIVVGAVEDLDENMVDPLENAGALYFYRSCTPTGSSLDTTACSSYTWELSGETYINSGVYEFITTGATGCDSIVILNLTLQSSPNDTIYVNSCDPFYWYETDSTYEESGIYQAVYQNVLGCDSILFLNYDRYPNYLFIDTIMACSEYHWDKTNITYNTSGLYYDTLTSANSCDSIFVLDLMIFAPVLDTIQVFACDTFYWDVSNVNYTTSGVYLDTLQTVNNCDSIIVLELSIFNSYRDTLNVTSCDSFYWDQSDSFYTQSGLYNLVYNSTEGCDSSVYLNLNIESSFKDTISISSCGNYYRPSNGITYDNSGIYGDTLQSVYSCDSIVWIDLTIFSIYQDTIEIEACETYVWQETNIEYDSSGVYSKAYETPNGCDSILYLNLVINPSFADTMYIEACDMYTWTNNQMYTESGVYIQSLQGQNGCDSILTLVLTISNSYYTEESVQACNNYYWQASGDILSFSGVYSDTLQSISGCDSVVVLNLQLDTEYIQVDSVMACNVYYWELKDEYYFEDGITIDSIFGQGVNGCDSINVLYLDLKQSVDSFAYVTSCETSYYWSENQTTYSNSGIYSFITYDDRGCDSLVVLNLTFENLESTVVDFGDGLLAEETNCNYQWYDCSAGEIIENEVSAYYYPSLSGSYAVISYNTSCSDTSECYNYQIDGIQEGDLESFNVFWSSSDQIFIEKGSSHKNNTFNLFIYSLQGQLLISMDNNTGDAYVDMGGYNAGPYLIFIQSDTQLYKVKVVKEN